MERGRDTLREKASEESRTIPSIVLVSSNPLETFRIGRAMAGALRGGDCVALIGELGAGKTALTQGIAKGIGIPDGLPVTSPTFTILNEYPGPRLTLFHMDAYRLQGCEDLTEMGYDEYLSGLGIMVIEWAERIIDAIPEDALIIQMAYVDEYIRRIEFSGLPSQMDLLKRSLTEEGY